MDKNNPIVSVYIPTYNRSDLLKRAINSVFEQTVKDVEIIVVDDNSPDDTPQVMAELMAVYPQLKYFRNSENQGACYNRNLAIRNATGRFVTGLDDDDYFLPNRLESFLTAWETKSPNAIALFDNVKIKKSEHDMESLSCPKSVDFDGLCLRNDVGNQIFAERSLFSDGIEYDEKLKSWQDLELWMHILAVNKNKCFQNIEKYTYIFDKSHPHERISSVNVDKHLNSFNYIKAKHALNGKNEYRLKCQAYGYNARSINPITLLVDACKSQSLYVVLRMSKYYLKNNKGM